MEESGAGGAFEVKAAPGRPGLVVIAGREEEALLVATACSSPPAGEEE